MHVGGDTKKLGHEVILNVDLWPSVEGEKRRSVERDSKQNKKVLETNDYGR